ncbi:helix-turn-helix transcriptional regulator [Natrinema salifodinae]|uniref:Predicted transcriptional regulator, contains HTH domain n=1 Tax=Natrinema salifodinae TaxID=1202768 RepID=A0A1I0QXK9_9EURY|nr:DNA-binding protein [Natrinema salifodinae]SEW31751.1 Predicted transcriptional regulator, contains HTH domain [Natrinema salifodinae]
MILETTDSPLDDIEFLARSEHRVVTLAALARRPQTRADLVSMTGVSQSTIGRTLRAFDERHWINREGRYYEATQLGAFVAAGVQELIDRLETEHHLRDVWQWLPSETSGFTVEMMADAVVTVAESDDPYGPVNRFKSLLRETNRFRFIGFDLALLEPCIDDLRQRIIDGMHAEVIDPPSVVDHIRSTHPEQFAEALESGNLTVWMYDDLPPYGVGLFDDRTVISGYDPTNGTVRALIDTDAPAAREWAESVYETYQREVPTIAIETDRELPRMP